MEEEVVSVKLVRLHKVCATRLAQRGLEAELQQVSAEVQSAKGRPKLAVAKLRFETALGQYRCLCSLLYTLIPVGSSPDEPATCQAIVQKDAA